MSNENTFGKEISRIWKELHFSQKELAELVLKEDNTPITPQYLNDIEHDRRSPSSDIIIKSFVKALQLSPDESDYLFYVAGKMPEDTRTLDKANFCEAITAFRRSNK